MAETTEATTQETEKTTETTQPKTFTQEDVDKLIGKYRTESKAEREAETQKALEKARADWERESKLTAEEKAKEASEKRNKELAEKEQTLALRENRADAREKLQERGISAELVNFVVDVDAEKTNDNIENLDKVFKQAVSEAVDKKLAGKTPEEKTNQQKTPAQVQHNRVF